MISTISLISMLRFFVSIQGYQFMYESVQNGSVSRINMAVQIWEVMAEVLGTAANAGKLHCWIETRPGMAAAVLLIPRRPTFKRLYPSAACPWGYCVTCSNA